MDLEVAQIAQLLNDTLNPDGNVVRSSTQALDRLSLLPNFPFSLLSIVAGGETPGQKVAAATYLKNFTRRNIVNSQVSKEFKDALLRTLLQVDSVLLKVLVEAFRIVLVAEFVEKNSWPELVSDVQRAIHISTLNSQPAISGLKAVNALTVLQTLIRPFQYFLNPKVAKEPVPPQLELIAKDILIPMLAVFHQLVEKVLSTHGRLESEIEKILLVVCKCVYFAVRSHMPSALVPVLPSFCCALIGLLGSLNFDIIDMEDEYASRMKAGKRSLLIFSVLVTRHRKYSDKLMPEIVNCALKIVGHSKNIASLDFLSERIISLAFDLVSHVLETGPGWRLVSPRFSFLLESAIFPALVLNKKDILEWEEDADEYIQKNLPSELGEISGWREDLFTARKSAINLLGVISGLKGPPVGSSSNVSLASSKRKKGEKNKKHNQRSSMGELLVIPFLSKYVMPSDYNSAEDRILNDYSGVLMAYGGLQDFLREQQPTYINVLICSRVLPLYTLSISSPYLIATANWVLGELASCLPQEMSADVYSSLLKALAIPNKGDISCYPVRVSAAGAISELLENGYQPPEWLPLLQVIIGRINIEDEETSVLFQLLSSVVEVADENIADHIPYMVSSLVEALSKFAYSDRDSWPQVVESGFSALAVMAKSWENLMPEEDEQIKSTGKWASGLVAIGRTLSSLLQQAWLSSVHPQEQEAEVSQSPTCIDDSSTLLRFIMLSVSGSNAISELKLSELLLAWAGLIADWDSWEESEDLSIFDCIKEVVNLHKKYGLKSFVVQPMPSAPAPPVPKKSIIEGIGTFISEAISQYPSATWRACSCVPMLLYSPIYPPEVNDVRESLVIAFTRAAWSRFKQMQSNPCPLWKPLLLAISSSYCCYPDRVEVILEKDVQGGFKIWASALAFTCTSSFEPGLSAKSEFTLTVMTLAKLIERLLGQNNSSRDLLRDCFNSLIEGSIRLKELQEGMEEDQDEDGDEENDEDDNDDYDDSDDEDSEGDELEETEEQFLERYAETAAALDNGITVDEGDVDDQEQEIELGFLGEIDEQRLVFSLIQRFHSDMVAGQILPSEIRSRFLNTFPECKVFFS
ncbi:hypothetical protein K2173_022526 [Erythroxylum novogranatense]|uniref:Importin N-terminal domain-containing protein n=1 Tax=Erythroxylum novogranatense TaxID=1862640 RepID=A0AAV8THU5_9ROSI|nr:hypothetical protein K2173_022526 [Erythroxylum novogranatense]